MYPQAWLPLLNIRTAFRKRMPTITIGALVSAGAFWRGNFGYFQKTQLLYCNVCRFSAGMCGGCVPLISGGQHAFGGFALTVER